MNRLMKYGRLPLVGVLSALALGGTTAAIGATGGGEKAAPVPTGHVTIIGPLVTNPGFSQSFSSVSCPANTKASGGGIFGSSSATTQNVNATFPSGTGWAGFMNNSSSSSSSFRVYAVCGFAI